MDKITQDEFQEYFAIQESGVTNMMNLGKVVDLSEGILDKDKVKIIMKNYEKLKAKFGTP